jgi:hypothetical protein
MGREKQKLTENNLLDYLSFSIHITSFRTVFPEIYLRRNISVKNGEDLSPDGGESRKLYWIAANRNKEERNKRKENKICTTQDMILIINAWNMYNKIFFNVKVRGYVKEKLV